MKKLCTLLLTSMVAIGAMAQDVIITKNDELIKVYNLEIGNNAIFYTLEDHNDAPINKMAKDDIFIIKKADGSKIDFSMPLSSTSSSASAIVEPQPQQNNAKNSQLISEWNNFKYEVTGLKENSNPKHNPTLVKLGIKPSSQLTDGNILIHYETVKWDYYSPDQTIVIKVENLTDKMIFLDMANSMFTEYNGTMIAMFTNSVTSSTKVGVVAGGVPLIGGASASANTTTQTERRMLPIPPHSAIEVPYGVYPSLYRKCSYGHSEKTRFANPLADIPVETIEQLPAGQSLFFKQEDQKRNMYFLISYSFTEDGKDEKRVRTDFYLQQILKLEYCMNGSDRYKQTGGISQVYMQKPKDDIMFITINHYCSGYWIDYSWYCE